MGPKLPYCLFKKIVFFTALFISVAAIETGIARTSLIASNSVVGTEDDSELFAESDKITDDQRDKINSAFSTGWKLDSISFEYNSNLLPKKSPLIFPDSKGQTGELSDSSHHDINVGSQESSSLFATEKKNDNRKPDGAKGFGELETIPPDAAVASTVAFASDSFTGREGTTVNLLIELVEAGDTAVSVEIVKVDSLSTVENRDIDNYSTQTVQFTEAENRTRTVSINLSSDSSIEGPEKAVFRLQNVSGGTVGEPSVTTLTIIDDTTDVTINEFLTDPPSGTTGDANNDGQRHRLEDQFVEIVNNGEVAVDISGWQLSSDEGSNIVHTFPEGTLLPSSKPIVVFGGGEPAGSFGGAIIQTSSNGSLDLPASGFVTLLDENGNIIEKVAYNEEETNSQSVTKISGDSDNFERHSQAARSSGVVYSPGVQADGSTFGSDYIVSLPSGEGWQLFSSPIRETAIEDLVQDFPGSDFPAAGSNTSIVTWDEKTKSFIEPSSMSDVLEAGKGYAVYISEKTDSRSSDTPERSPKITYPGNIEGDEDPSAVNVTVTATDSDGNDIIDGREGWNLLGNPFGTPISVNALFTTLESANENVNMNIYVWDPEKEGEADYVIYSPGDNRWLSPYQAFWIRYTEDGIETDVTFNKKELTENTGADFLEKSSSKFGFSLEVHGKQGFDTYELEFTEEGEISLDRYDAYKLFSLEPQSISLYSTLNANRLTKNVLPRELESSLEIPLYYRAPPGNSSLSLRWDSDELPADWDIFLIDQKNNREIDLKSNSEYRFDIDNASVNNASSDNEQLLNESEEEEEQNRFILRIRAGESVSQNSEDLPETAKLKPNYPNPFSNTTTIPFELAQEEEVTLTVWNMIGQKVATLVDGVREGGEHTDVQWDATNMPSGMYIARFEVAGQVFTRKMTLIK